MPRKLSPLDLFRIKHSHAIKQWRRAVLEAAAGQCAGCAYTYRKYKVSLQPHHLYGVAWFDVATVALPANGVALCLRCHRDFHLRFPTRCTPAHYVEWQRLRWGRVIDEPIVPKPTLPA